MGHIQLVDLVASKSPVLVMSKLTVMVSSGLYITVARGYGQIVVFEVV